MVIQDDIEKLLRQRWHVVLVFMHAGALARRYGIEFAYADFELLSFFTGLERSVVRRACRRLRRMGLMVYSSGLVTATGMKGSGYAVSEYGYEVWRTIHSSLERAFLDE